MKINYIGNICNYAYWWALSTKSLGNHQAEVFIPHTTNPRDVPWADDPSLDRNNLPEWMHMMPYDLPYYRSILPIGKVKKMYKVLGECDVIHAFGAGLFWTQFAKVPFVYQSYGDINGAPFFTKWWPPSRIAGNAVFRLSLNMAKKIIVSQLIDIRSVEVLGLKDRMVLLPMLYDCDKVSPCNSITNYALADKYRNWELIFFSPSRHYSFKGNRKIIRAFSSFLSGSKKDSVLILVERGTEIAQSKQLIEDLGIGDFVEWIPLQDKKGLMSYLSLKRLAVVDQFWGINDKATLGGVSRDAMAMATPLITHISLEEITKLHNTAPPILYTDHTEESIINRMMEFSEMGHSERESLGKKEREWMIEEHHYSNLLPRYWEVYKECL